MGIDFQVITYQYFSEYYVECFSRCLLPHFILFLLCIVFNGFRAIYWRSISCVLCQTIFHVVLLCRMVFMELTCARLAEYHLDWLSGYFTRVRFVAYCVAWFSTYILVYFLLRIVLNGFPGFYITYAQFAEYFVEWVSRFHDLRFGTFVKNGFPCTCITGTRFAAYC